MKYSFTTEQLEKMYRNPWLTDRERRVFNLYYRKGWAVETVAAELYVSRNTVNNVLRDIRRKTVDWV